MNLFLLNIIIYEHCEFKEKDSMHIIIYLVFIVDTFLHITLYIL